MIEARSIRVSIRATGNRLVLKGLTAEGPEGKPELTGIRGNGEYPLHCRLRTESCQTMWKNPFGLNCGVMTGHDSIQLNIKSQKSSKGETT